jgi:hypothetical protein
VHAPSEHPHKPSDHKHTFPQKGDLQAQILLSAEKEYYICATYFSSPSKINKLPGKDRKKIISHTQKKENKKQKGKD